MAVARSSSSGVVLRYVLPVLWMMSHLAVMGRMAEGLAALSKGDQLRARPGQSLMSMNACLSTVLTEELAMELLSTCEK